MRTLTIAALFCFVSGCARTSQAPAPGEGFQPIVLGPPQLDLLPDDLTSRLDDPAPTLAVVVLDAQSPTAAQLVEALPKAIAVLDPSGQPLPADIRALDPGVREINSERFEPAGVQISLATKLEPGWHQVVVDLGKLPAADQVPHAFVQGGTLVGRFNVASAPVVRRAWICPDLGQVHLAFSEPVVLATKLTGALVLRDESGADLGCVTSPDQGALYQDGERLSVKCAGNIPPVVQLVVPKGALVGEATKEPVLDVSGEEFAPTVVLDGLAPDGEHCRVFVPGSGK